MGTRCVFVYVNIYFVCLLCSVAPAHLLCSCKVIVEPFAVSFSNADENFAYTALQVFTELKVMTSLGDAEPKQVVAAVIHVHIRQCRYTYIYYIYMCVWSRGKRAVTKQAVSKDAFDVAVPKTLTWTLCEDCRPAIQRQRQTVSSALDASLRNWHSKGAACCQKRVDRHGFWACLTRI